MIRCLSFAKPIWTVSFGSVNILVCLMSNGFECTKTTIIEYRSISWSKTEFSPILIGLNLENQKEWNDFTVPVLRMVVCSSWRYVIFFFHSLYRADCLQKFQNLRKKNRMWLCMCITVSLHGSQWKHEFILSQLHHVTASADTIQYSITAWPPMKMNEENDIFHSYIPDFFSKHFVISS